MAFDNFSCSVWFRMNVIRIVASPCKKLIPTPTINSYNLERATSSTVRHKATQNVSYPKSWVFLKIGNKALYELYDFLQSIYTTADHLHNVKMNIASKYVPRER